MDTPKHTPGPWHAEGPDEFGDFNIHTPAYRLAIGAAVSNMRPEDETVANANIMAAAPDLLEALKGMLAHSCVADSAAEDKDPEDHAAESAARRAIAKAEGREGC